MVQTESINAEASVLCSQYIDTSYQRTTAFTSEERFFNR